MVLIESLASGGEGVGHLQDGRVVFVQGSCPGDQVEIEIIAEKKRWVSAKVARILEPSPDRVTPPCPYFGECGGCQWQHVSYEVQLVAKRRIVADALERLGGISAQGLVAECRPSPSTYGYRNKVELVPVSERPLRLGFHRLGSEEVLEVERCLLLPKTHDSAPGRLAGALRYASGTQDLGIRRVGLRVAVGTSDVEVALWTPPSAFPRGTAATTLKDSVKATSVVRVLANETRERHTAKSVEVLSGRGSWRELLGGVSYAVSAPSFFQVNTRAAEILVQETLDALSADGSDDVLDLFAGVGTFTLPVSDRARSITAVEGSGFALRDLRRNLDTTHRVAEVVAGDASRVVADIGSFNAVLVDPPRAGLESSLVGGIARTRASRVVYVSCDPATLARDARALAEAGYRLASAVPLDVFPQTYHVETVALFELNA